MDLAKKNNSLKTKKMITADEIRNKHNIHERVLVEAYSDTRCISFIGVLLFATKDYFYVGNTNSGQAKPQYAPKKDRKILWIWYEIETAFKLYPRVFIGNLDLIKRKQPHRGFGIYLERSTTSAEDYNSFTRDLEQKIIH